MNTSKYLKIPVKWITKGPVNGLQRKIIIFEGILK